MKTQIPKKSSHEGFTVSITKYLYKNVSIKIINPGFLYPNYEVYGITTPLSNDVIYRSQEDFYYLRKCLIKQYPGHPIPILTKTLVEKSEAKYVNKRKEKQEELMKKLNLQT